MAQKIIKIGSSLGITLSKNLLKEQGVGVGDAVRVSAVPGERKMIIEYGDEVRDGVSAELVSWTNDFIEKNRELLKRLADK